MTENTEPSLTRGLAEGVRERGIRMAYGESQDLGGATIVPVAIVTYGFGGSDESAQWGVGGGGGGAIIPLGAYVGAGGRVRFRANTVIVLGMLIPLVFVIGNVLARVFRR